MRKLLASGQCHIFQKIYTLYIVNRAGEQHQLDLDTEEEELRILVHSWPPRLFGHEDDYLGIFDGTKVDDDGGEEEDEDGEGEGDHPPAAVADCATAVQKQPTFVPEKFISETHLNTILST